VSLDEEGEGDSFRPGQEWRTLGLLLDQFNELEHLLGQIVEGYVRPAESRADFVRKVLLHNTVTSYGSKVKLVGYITRTSHGPAVDIERLHTLGRLRNAVAHTPMLHGLRFNRNALRGPVGTFLVVESPNAKLEFSERPREAVVGDFFDGHHKAKSELEALLSHVQGLP